MAKDFYQTLGISRDADEKAIKNAYRKLAREFHPDVNPTNPNAEAKFKEISSAFQVLSDAEKRKLYDQFGEDFDKIPPEYAKYGPQRGESGGAGSYGGGFSQGVNFEELLRNAEHGGPNTRVEFRGGGEDPNDPGGIFGQFFGGSRGQRKRAPQRGGDVEHSVEISFVESIKGTQRQLNLVIRGENGREERRDVTVKIPALVNDGATVRVAGKGASGSPNGDLLLQIRVKPDAFWKREGLDVRIEVPVSFVEAALGATISVPTWSGEIGLKIAAGTQSGQTIRLSKRGLKNEKTGAQGDQYVSVKVVVPKDLAPREEELLRELGAIRNENPRATLPKMVV